MVRSCSFCQVLEPVIAAIDDFRNLHDRPNLRDGELLFLNAIPELDSDDSVTHGVFIDSIQ